VPAWFLNSAAIFEVSAAERLLQSSRILIKEKLVASILSFEIRNDDATIAFKRVFPVRTMRIRILWARLASDRCIEQRRKYASVIKNTAFQFRGATQTGDLWHKSPMPKQALFHHSKRRLPQMSAFRQVLKRRYVDTMFTCALLPLVCIFCLSNLFNVMDV
jgi:hypothetical protein